MWLEVLEAWYFRQAGMGVVPGAQFYTRLVWGWSLGPSSTPGKWDEYDPQK